MNLTEIGLLLSVFFGVVMGFFALRVATETAFLAYTVNTAICVTVAVYLVLHL